MCLAFVFHGNGFAINKTKKAKGRTTGPTCLLGNYSLLFHIVNMLPQANRISIRTKYCNIVMQNE